MPRSFPKVLVAAAAALLVGGCAITVQPSSSAIGLCPAPDRANPQVNVVDGQIEIDQPVLVFPKSETDVTVYWRLPPGGKLTWPDNGIAFEPKAREVFTDCRVRDDARKVFGCRHQHTRPGEYRYDMRVRVDGERVIERDPFVMDK